MAGPWPHHDPEGWERANSRRPADEERWEEVMRTHEAMAPARDASNRTRETISKGLDAASRSFDHPAEYREHRRRQALAQSFREDPALERLLKLRDSDSDADRRAYERMVTPETRMRLGYYQEAKQAAQEVARER